MTVRRAAADDLPILEELREARRVEFQLSGPVEVDPGEERRLISEVVAAGDGFVAETDAGEVVGFALVRATAPGRARLADTYVVPGARREGIGASLLAEIVVALEASGVEAVEVEVPSTRADARSVYTRWGFREEAVLLAASVAGLRERLVPGRHSVSFASIHVQTDERSAVERAVGEFAPRVGSRESRVEGPRNGWVAVYDRVADDDPNVLLRFARELSERMGIVVVALALELDQVVRLIALDRGGIVDEYLSVPEFYGSLPPGDVIGMAANPTVLARLTGADPAEVKGVAVTAPTPAELPPARELLREIAAVLGLEGADHGYEEPG